MISLVDYLLLEFNSSVAAFDVDFSDRHTYHGSLICGHEMYLDIKASEVNTEYDEMKLSVKSLLYSTE